MNAIFDVAAPAKLNLFLHVVGRRNDGYHLLQSVFALIDWFDTLHFELRRDGRLTRRDLTTPLPADDLCLRAARALQRASGTALGADMSIEKSIPSGAGLGGGSSDAASVLLALNRLWQLNWPQSRLMELGLALGADVPFFVGGRNAFVEGIGDRITPLTLAPRWFAVVKPPAGIETRAVFQHPQLIRDFRAATLEGFTFDGEWNARADFGRNDLQIAAQAICSDVSDVLSWLEARFGNSRMTGSGSAAFSVIEPPNTGTSESAAPPIGRAGLLSELPSGWDGKICRSLRDHPLRGWALEDAASWKVGSAN